MSTPFPSDSPAPPPQTVKFRRGNERDAESVSAFARRLFEETFGAQNDARDMGMYTAKAFTPTMQRGELEDPTRVCVIGERDGTISSYALLRIGSLHSAVQAKAPVEIERFYVDSALHGQGVAGAMMDETVRIAGATGADTLWLGVWSQNARAIRFYEKRGFIIVGSQTFLLGTDVQIDHVMARSLKA